MKKITQFLNSGKLLVADGAWGTFLQQRGLKPGECPELWCVEHRDIVLEIPTSYVNAGAMAVKTNSFGGNSFKLEHYGLQERAGELNEAAASISRQAAGKDRFVMASIGPTGKILLYDETPEERIYESFKEQAVAFERGGADACLIETFAALDEATLAVRAAKENTGLEVIVTFTFEKTVQGEYRTMMGVSPADMAAAMIAAGADIVGTNCGNGMERMAEITREIRKAAPAIPIAVNANAGMPRNVDGHDVFPETPEMMAKNAMAVVKAGAGLVGGCCGTTPAHIKAIIEAVAKR
ncbi:MAG: methionine synthase [Verrucomicrobia bacterium]|nr:methionine synthase [Verrucomicrobiota bacterium]